MTILILFDSFIFDFFSFEINFSFSLKIISETIVSLTALSSTILSIKTLFIIFCSWGFLLDLFSFLSFSVSFLVNLSLVFFLRFDVIIPPFKETLNVSASLFGSLLLLIFFLLFFSSILSLLSAFIMTLFSKLSLKFNFWPGGITCWLGQLHISVKIPIIILSFNFNYLLFLLNFQQIYLLNKLFLFFI